MFIPLIVGCRLYRWLEFWMPGIGFYVVFKPSYGVFCLLLIDWHVVVLVGLVVILFCLCPVVGSQACFVAVVSPGRETASDL